MKIVRKALYISASSREEERLAPPRQCTAARLDSAHLYSEPRTTRPPKCPADTDRVICLLVKWSEYGPFQHLVGRAITFLPGHPLEVQITFDLGQPAGHTMWNETTLEFFRKCGNKDGCHNPSRCSRPATSTPYTSAVLDLAMMCLQ